MQLHPGRDNVNAVTFGEKGNAVTSLEGKVKCSYIREGKRKIHLHSGMEK